MKKIIAIVLTVLILPATSAFAGDTFTEATESEWGVISTNDGFEKSYTIYKDGDEQGYDDMLITYTIEIQCTKKKLSVLIYSDPLGMYPTTTFNSIDGYALTRVDSGKINKFSYVALKDYSGIALLNDKQFTTAILKGKKFAVKVPSNVQNDTVAKFSVADLSSHSAKFKSLGCSLK
jgi:hypothetical protein